MPITLDKNNKITGYVENEVPAVKSGVDGKRVHPSTLPNFGVSQFSRTFDAIVDPNGGADFKTIEYAVDYVTSIGGGDIFVRAGTYTPSKTITIQKPINIIGVSPSLVTVNFNSTSRNFTVSSTNQYTTGTITAASGVNITGSGTSWLANVQAGYHLFLGTRWYKIAAVTDNTHLVLAESYFDNVSLPATYRIANIPTDVSFESILVLSSTGTGVSVTDCKTFIGIGLVIAQCNKGITLDNTSLIIINGTTVAASTSNGVEFNTCGVASINGLQANGNGGHGIVFNGCKVFGVIFSEANNNTSDGVNITSCSLLDLQVNARSNGGQGIECVSGNDQILLDECSLVSNTSDGIKLTATSDYCKIIGCHFDTNGAYGVNIAAASCDKNVVIGNSFNANTSGTVSDSGTNTVVANNTI